MFTGGEPNESLAVLRFNDIDPLNGVAATEHDITLPQLMNKFIADFLIEKLKWAWPLIDDCHLNAQSSKHRGVFDSDYSSSDHGQGSWQLLQIQNVVRGNQRLSVRLDPVRFARPGTDRNQDVVTRDQTVAIRFIDADCIGIDESRMTVNQIDIVPSQRIADVLQFALNTRPT